MTWMARPHQRSCGSEEEARPMRPAECRRSPAMRVSTAGNRLTAHSYSVIALHGARYIAQKAKIDAALGSHHAPAISITIDPVPFAVPADIAVLIDRGRTAGIT